MAVHRSPSIHYWLYTLGLLTIASISVKSMLNTPTDSGIHNLTLSLGIIALPLLAACFSLPASGLLYGSFHIIKRIFSRAPFTGGIPTLCAHISFYFYFNNKTTSTLSTLFHLGIPLVSAVSFAHAPSIGYGAFYALLWIIPCSIHLLQLMKQCQHYFWFALKSSFIAHATGSVIWAYATTTYTPDRWIALMPVALGERISIAALQSVMIFLMFRATQDQTTTAVVIDPQDR